MLGAPRLMTVERGIDPRGFALMPFGGAGPLHAASMAGELGISRDPQSRARAACSALSASPPQPPRRDVSRTLLLTSTRSRPSVFRASAPRSGPGRARHSPPSPRARGVRHELRYVGQSFELPVHEEPSRTNAWLGPAELREAFEAAHEQRYGYRDGPPASSSSTCGCPPGDCRPRWRRWRARGTRGAAPGACSSSAESPSSPRFCRASRTRRDGRRVPRLCGHAQSTLLVPPGWTARVDEHGTVRMHARRIGVSGA